MVYKIINKTESRTLRSSAGVFFMEKGESVELNNEKDAKSLGELEGIEIKELSEPEPVDIDAPEGFVDYTQMKASELRSIASKIGIKSAYRMRKNELISSLGKKEEELGV